MYHVFYLMLPCKWTEWNKVYLIWFEEDLKANRFDREMPQPHTMDQAKVAIGRDRSTTATRQLEHNWSKSTSSLFISKMIAKLHRKQRTTKQNQDPTQNFHKQWGQQQTLRRPGLKVIKLQYSLKLKIQCNDWLLADTCPQAANHHRALFFLFENELKFYNLKARSLNNLY